MSNKSRKKQKKKYDKLSYKSFNESFLISEITFYDKHVLSFVLEILALLLVAIPAINDLC